MLQNMLSDGFNQTSNICELIDDSLGAGAKHVRISLETKELKMAVADLGHGMDHDGLQNGHVLHNRGKPSKTKHGRFGIGRGHALAGFTQLKGKMTAISRHLDCPEGTTEEANKYQGINILTIDYPNVMLTGEMPLRANELGFSSLALWMKHSIDPMKRGTVTLMDVPKEVMDEFIAAIKTPDITKNLQYRLGLTYYKFIQGGGKITVVIDGAVIPILAIDPLLFTKVSVDNKRMQPMTVYQSKETGEFRAYFVHKNKTTRREFPDVGKAKLIVEDVPVGWTKIGVVTIANSYSKAWVPEYKAALETMGIKIANRTDVSSDYPQEDFLGGKYIERNGKIIARFETLEPTSGDFSKRRDTVKSHSLIVFNATDNEDDPTRTTLDDVFKVMVNKSKLDKLDIEPNVWKTVEWFCSEFAKDMGNLYAPVAAPAPRPVPAPVTPAPVTPAPVTPAPVTPAPIRLTAQVPIPAPVNPIVPVPIPAPVVDITFSKTPDHVVICEKTKEVYRIRYAGQYHVHEQALQQNLLKLGPARFKEYAKGLQDLNAMFNA
jgi:hypothetical protein